MVHTFFHLAAKLPVDVAITAEDHPELLATVDQVLHLGVEQVQALAEGIFWVED